MLAETTARILVPQPPKPRVTVPDGYSPFTHTAEGLRGVYVPHSAFAHVYDMTTNDRGYFNPDGRIDYRINNLGFRGEDISALKPPGVRRILCLGDSFTFGEGVRETDAWPERLGQILGPKTEVINAGIQGFDLDSEGLLLLLYGRRLAPDIVILGFFMNDAMPFGETIPQQSDMIAAPAPLSKLGRCSPLWRFFERRRAAVRQTRRYVADLRKSFTTEHWREARARIPRLRMMADHDGFKILAVIFPLLYELDGDYPLEQEHVEVQRAFAEAGIAVIDLLDSYRGRKAADLWVHVTDPHPNEIAHAIAAERIARAIGSLAR